MHVPDQPSLNLLGEKATPFPPLCCLPSSPRTKNQNKKKYRIKIQERENDPKRKVIYTQQTPQSHYPKVMVSCHSQKFLFSGWPLKTLEEKKTKQSQASNKTTVQESSSLSLSESFMPCFSCFTFYIRVPQLISLTKNTVTEKKKQRRNIRVHEQTNTQKTKTPNPMLFG